jgi:hypothetical protein
MRLTAAERARGWAVFKCPEHGPLVVTDAWATVTCSCGKRAVPYRGKAKVRAAEARALRAAL